jgi:hypothetical protein
MTTSNAETTASPGPAGQDGHAGPQRAPISRRWLIKFLIMLLVVLGVAVWGYLDAVSIYPKRGERYASWAQWQYLLALDQADLREDPGILSRESSIADPKAELARLTEREQAQRDRTDAADQTSPRHFRANMRLARERWFTALSRIGRLTPEGVAMSDPRGTLKTLNDQWSTQTGNPKPLSAFDIPSQWLIMGVCLALALWQGSILLRTVSKRYVYDGSSKTLAVPGGSFSASDLAERLDKRKWDKFIVFASVKDGHALAGGNPLRFDTYRHDKLESWLLEMEEAAFGPEEDAQAAEGQSAKPAEAPAETA